MVLRSSERSQRKKIRMKKLIIVFIILIYFIKTTGFNHPTLPILEIRANENTLRAVASAVSPSIRDSISRMIEKKPCPERLRIYKRLAQRAKEGNRNALKLLVEAAFQDEVLSTEIYEELLAVGNPEAIDAFRFGLTHPRFMVRKHSQKGLRNLGKLGQDVLDRMLDSENEEEVICALEAFKGRQRTREDILAGKYQELTEQGFSDLTILLKLEQIYPHLRGDIQKLAEDAYRSIGRRGYPAPIGERYVSPGVLQGLYPKLTSLIRERLAENKTVIIRDEAASDLTNTVETWEHIEEEFPVTQDIRVIGSDLFLTFFVLTPKVKNKLKFDSCVFNTFGNVIQLSVKGNLYQGQAIEGPSFKELKEELKSIFARINIDESFKFDNRRLEFNSRHGIFELKAGQFRNPRAKLLREQTQNRFSYQTHDLFIPLEEQADIILLFNVLLPEVFDANEIFNALKTQGKSLKQGGYLVAGYHSHDCSGLEFRPMHLPGRDGVVINYEIYQRQDNKLVRIDSKEQGLGLSSEEAPAEISLTGDIPAPSYGNISRLSTGETDCLSLLAPRTVPLMGTVVHHELLFAAAA